MAMKRKLVLFIAGYFSAAIITGLISCDDCGPFPDKFKVTSFDWKVYRVALTQNNLTLSEIITSVSFSELGIYIKPKTKEYFSFWRNNYHLIPTTYACDPIIPTTNERIKDIIIMSDKDFSSDFPAGMDISELFDIVISDPNNNAIADKYDLKAYVQTHPFVTREITLLLKVAPDRNDEFEFTIKYFQDGIDLNYYEFSTGKVSITI